MVGFDFSSGVSGDKSHRRSVELTRVCGALGRLRDRLAREGDALDSRVRDGLIAKEHRLQALADRLCYLLDGSAQLLAPPDTPSPWDAVPRIGKVPPGNAAGVEPWPAPVVGAKVPSGTDSVTAWSSMVPGPKGTPPASNGHGVTRSIVTSRPVGERPTGYVPRLQGH